VRSSTWHALGNTYRLVEPEGAPLDPVRVRELASGTDGVLEVVAVRPRAVEIVIWNPDGSQAELSGNGTRIAAAWLLSRTGASEVDVLTAGRVTRARRLEDGAVEQELGDVTVGKTESVVGVVFTPVSVGNPHAVVVGDPDEIVRIGPLLECHPRFPNRTNVQVVRVDGPGEVTARVWERGVGETRSSGTSAVAVAAATHSSGDVLVHFPGGDLRVSLSEGRARLVGPAERVD
jgi:diaminopimelate epimerase